MNPGERPASTPAEPHARILDRPLDPRDCERVVLSARDGAVVTFTGVVRDHDGGRSVAALRYEAHPAAQRLLAGVCDAHARPDVRVAAEHRVGDLVIGDLAVVVAVAAPHRGEAFAVCEALIDAVKSQVPIWKRQRFTDGEIEWVDPTRCTPGA